MSPPRFTHRHKNGGFYRMLGIARHPNTFREIVVYVDGYGCMWFRTPLQFERSFTPIPTPAEVEATVEAQE